MTVGRGKSEVGLREPRRFGPFHDFLRSRLGKRGDKKALADATGIFPSNINTWLERGSQPNIDYVERIARYYGVSLDFLITGEDFLAGRDPYTVELCRLLLQLEGDRDFLQPLEAMIRERIRQKRGADGAPSTADPDETEQPGAGEERALPPRG